MRHEITYFFCAKQGRQMIRAHFWRADGAYSTNTFHEADGGGAVAWVQRLKAKYGANR